MKLSICEPAWITGADCWQHSHLKDFSNGHQFFFFWHILVSYSDISGDERKSALLEFGIWGFGLPFDACTQVCCVLLPAQPAVPRCFDTALLLRSNHPVPDAPPRESHRCSSSGNVRGAPRTTDRALHLPPFCSLGHIPNPALYFPQSTVMQLVLSFLSFHALYNVAIKNHFHIQAAGTALSVSSTCRWWCR